MEAVPHLGRGEQVEQRQQHVLVDLHQHVHQRGVRQEDHDLLGEQHRGQQAGLFPRVQAGC